MHSYPYLLGQLLKAADGLHEYYCDGVREGQMPPQLVGSSFYISASEMPKKTLAQLGLRMTPYISWAKTHRSYRLSHYGAGDKSSPPAGWFLSLFEEISTELYEVLSDDTRFNDRQKAELFLGYVGAFPKKTKDDKMSEQGGKEYEM